MAAFNYKALDSAGKEKKGVLEGDSPRQVRQKLREQGLTPLEITAVSEKGGATKKTSAIKKTAILNILSPLHERTRRNVANCTGNIPIW